MSASNNAQIRSFPLAPEVAGLAPPVCKFPGHGRMKERKPGTPEQAFCGKWFTCERCEAKDQLGRVTVLYPSVACNAQLAEQRQAVAGAKAIGRQGRLL